MQLFTTSVRLMYRKLIKEYDYDTNNNSTD